MQITYSQVGDYNLPNLSTPQEEKPLLLGKYSLLRKKFLENHKRVKFINLLTSCKLGEHLAQVEEEAQEMVEEIVTTLAKAKGVDEQMKATDQMLWVGYMNTFKSQAEEVVLKELIYV